jgi:hypothetical protein
VLKSHGARRFEWATVACLPKALREPILAQAAHRAAALSVLGADASGRQGRGRSVRAHAAAQQAEAREVASEAPVLTVVDVRELVRRVYMVPEFASGEQFWRLNPFKWERPPADYRPLHGN